MMEYWNTGMMEYWSAGIKWEKGNIHSIKPINQYEDLQERQSGLYETQSLGRCQAAIYSHLEDLWGSGFQAG